MLAGVLKEKQKIILEEVSPGVLQKDEVRIKVEYCGICGSDLSRFVQGIHPGLILGHEFSGTIEETGENVKTWRKEDRVVVNPMPFCREYFQCRSGATNLCARGLTGVGLERPGAFAQYCSVSQDMLYVLPPKLDFAGGALLAPVFMLTPNMGAPFIGKLFVIMILGGLGSVGGAIVGSYILGIAENLFSGYLWSEWTYAVGFILLILILSFRPKGLFGKE